MGVFSKEMETLVDLKVAASLLASCPGKVPLGTSCSYPSDSIASETLWRKQQLFTSTGQLAGGRGPATSSHSLAHCSVHSKAWFVPQQCWSSGAGSFCLFSVAHPKYLAFFPRQTLRSMLGVPECCRVNELGGHLCCRV